MHDDSSRFLDRIQKESGIRERGRALSGVRAVFYSLFCPLGREGASGLAETLPPELESLWKPAYFQCLRDDLNGAREEGSVEDALRRVQRLTPTVDTEEAGRLLGSVVRVLQAELEKEIWEEVQGRLPGGIHPGDPSPTGVGDGAGD